MSTLSINTTQNVNIDFVTASVGERVLASLIDIIIKAAYLFITFQIFDVTTRFVKMLETTDQWNFFAVIILIISPVFFYSLIFETLLEGQTPGKRIMKIKVIKIDGFQASFPDYLIRWIMRIIDTTILNGVVALISVIVSDKNQRLGDMVAGTAVISLKSRTDIQHTILMNIEEAYQPKYPAVAYLSDNDARIIKNAYEQALRDDNHELFVRLRTKIESVLNIQKAGIDDAVFIGDILRDFNYYTSGSFKPERRGL